MLNDGDKSDSPANVEVRTQANIHSKSIYPEATKHLPGNNNVDELPPTKAPSNPQARKVYKRIQSLFFFTIAIIVFGIISILVLLANHRGFQLGDKPLILEIAGYTVAVLPIICSIVLLVSKQTIVIKLALWLLLIAYASIVLITFGMIIENFTNFFTGIGLVCLLHIGFMLWTRQELNDVGEIR